MIKKKKKVKNKTHKLVGIIYDKISTNIDGIKVTRKSMGE